MSGSNPYEVFSQPLVTERIPQTSVGLGPPILLALSPVVAALAYFGLQHWPQGFRVVLSAWTFINTLQIGTLSLLRKRRQNKAPDPRDDHLEQALGFALFGNLPPLFTWLAVLAVIILQPVSLGLVSGIWLLSSWILLPLNGCCAFVNFFALLMCLHPFRQTVFCINQLLGIASAILAMWVLAQ